MLCMSLFILYLLFSARTGNNQIQTYGNFVLETGEVAFLKVSRTISEMTGLKNLGSSCGS